MLDNLYFKLLALAPPESAFLAVTGRSVNVRALVSKIAYRACAFIMAAAIIYGCWVLFEGFVDGGSSTSRKKGLVSILGGALICGLIYTMYQMIFI